MSNQNKIAAGFDNQGGLQALHEVSSPLFYRYYFDNDAEWGDSETAARTGAHTIKRLGLPSAAWLFPVLTGAELELIRTTYFVGVEDTAEVTITTENRHLNVFQTFNAIMEWPTGRAYLGEWRDVRITFRDLKLYSGFDYGFDSRAFGA